MKRAILDQHTHTSFSHDSNEPMLNQITAARELGFKYLAFTEHWDLDCLYLGDPVPQLDLEAYTNACRAYQKAEPNMYIACGVEASFCTLGNRQYADGILKYDFDVVINSVHTVGNLDPYFPNYYEGVSKPVAYGKYFKAIRQSLEVPYRYDVIGHIGYAMRYCPYADRSPDDDSWQIIEDIFKRAISLGKTVEVNTHIKDTGLGSVPTFDMLKLYRDLGGEDVTFSSDAHTTTRLGDKWEPTSEMLKSLGFNYLSYFIKGEKLRVKF